MRISSLLFSRVNPVGVGDISTIRYQSTVLAFEDVESSQNPVAWCHGKRSEIFNLSWDLLTKYIHYTHLGGKTEPTPARLRGMMLQVRYRTRICLRWNIRPASVPGFEALLSSPTAHCCSPSCSLTPRSSQSHRLVRYCPTRDIEKLDGMSGCLPAHWPLRSISLWLG